MKQTILELTVIISIVVAMIAIMYSMPSRAELQATIVQIVK